jgi:carbon storage regulator
MLVLSRRLNEKVVLPGLNVTVQVVAIENGRVRLGFEAPPQVPILREELAAGAGKPARRSGGVRQLCRA